MRTLLFLLQATTATGGNATLPVPRDFDLAKVRSTADPCAPGAVDIVVCGRVKAVSPPPSTIDYAEKPVRAEARLPGGGTIAAKGQQRTLPQGASAPALMFSLKLPF